MFNDWSAPAFVVLATAAIGAAGSAAFRRIRRERAAETGNDGLVLYVTVAAALLGTYLGFLSVSVWETRSAAETSARQESADLLVLYQLSSTHPVETRAQLQAGILGYARSIVEVEWPRMAEGDVADLFHRSPELQLLWTIHLAPAAADGGLYASSAVDRLSALASAREIRLLSSTTGLSPHIWFTISLAVALNLGLLMLMRVEESALHATMMACFASLVGILLWGIYDLQTPYNGSWSVSAEPFEQAVKQMETALRASVR